jgi:hypothetical protein
LTLGPLAKSGENRGTYHLKIQQEEDLGVMRKVLLASVGTKILEKSNANKWVKAMRLVRRI